MILHLVSVHNETNLFLREFELQFPRENVILCFLNNGGFIKTWMGKSEQYTDSKSAIIDIDFSIISVVVVHMMTFTKEKFIVRFVPSSIPIVWWMFGGDLYNHFLYSKGYKLYSEQTIPYVGNKTASNLFLKIKNFVHAISIRPLVDHIVCKRIIGVTPCNIVDYKLACGFLKRKVDLVDISPRLEILNLPFTQGNDILLGHSASLTNNHLYALQFVKHINLGESKLFMTLSYNVQSEKYKDKVIHEYRKYFGDKVYFILLFQKAIEYQKSFLNYKVAIFPCWRQEALGNIYMCFQLGIKVFLSKNNPCFENFIQVGYHVYAIEDIHGERDFDPLSQKEKEENRSLFVKEKKERDRVIPLNLNCYFSTLVSTKNERVKN